MQVIACAGSGKTEAISCRVAALVKEAARKGDFDPAAIVAFTFTEKAAASRKAPSRRGPSLGRPSSRRRLGARKNHQRIELV